MNIDYESYVSRADLYYDKPVENSWDGLPIGNGRMGTIVWTGPRTLNFQINRVDVFATGSATTAPDWRMDSPEYYGINEYCGGCGAVHIDMGGDIAPDGVLVQHLSFYDATATLDSSSVSAQVFASARNDAIVLRLQRKKATSDPVRLTLKLLRAPEVKKRGHTARSRFVNDAGYNGIEQIFEECCDTGINENDHYCRSVMLVGLAEGGIAEVVQRDEKSLELILDGKDEEWRIAISSAASFDRNHDVIAAAEAELKAVTEREYADVLQEHRAWWREFWSRSFIHVPRYPLFGLYWTTYIYYMGSCMRGDYPAKFNGLIWPTHGDLRFWGGQYWWYNTSRFHYGLDDAGHGDLKMPLFRMLLSNIEKYEIAARQQWKAEGIYLPETEAFDGPEILPDDVARELSDFVMNRIPAGEKLKQFLPRRSGMNARWALYDNVEDQRKGVVGAFSWHSNVVYNAADVANSMWDHYLHTGDVEFLRIYAYPWMRGVAEFYRTFANLRREDDGLYHIHETGWCEHVAAARDVIHDLAMMRGVFPATIKASEILGIDEGMRTGWREIVDNLAPYPRSDMPDALHAPEHPAGFNVYAVLREPAIQRQPHSQANSNDWLLLMIYVFDLLNLETKEIDPAEWELTMHSLDAQENVKQIQRDSHPTHYNWGYVWNRIVLKAARMGRTDLVLKGLPLLLRQFTIPTHYGGHHENWHFPNRMPWTNELNSPSIQEMGTFSDCLQAGLLQSVAPGPGGDSVIHVLPAWPTLWDTVFKLHARGDIQVAASQKDGTLEWVQLRAGKAGTCRLRNPWGDARVRIRRGDRSDRNVEDADGRVIELVINSGEELVLTREDDDKTAPDRLTFGTAILTDAVSVHLPFYENLPVLAPGERTRIAVVPAQEGVTFQSSDATVLTVDNTGVVSGLRIGSVEIRAYGDGKIISRQHFIVRDLVVNDFDPEIVYTGDWKKHWYMMDSDYLQDPRYMERRRPWFDDYHYTDAPGAAVEYQFEADCVAVIGMKGPLCGKAEVYLDGELAATVDANFGEVSPQEIVFEANSLGPGCHSIKLINVEGRLVLDALRLSGRLPNPSEKRN